MAEQSQGASSPATTSTATTTATKGASSSRLAALDGLRGIVAFIVVIHHTAMTFNPIAAAMMRPRDYHPHAWSVPWLLTRTPGYLAIAGHEAVFIFFVLSGVVLTLPRLKARPEPWKSYYPKRLVRLYVPVIAAVLFAGILFRLVHRHTHPGDSVWLQNAALTYPPTHMLRDMVLLAFISGAVSPLWSLTYEMYFSLLLPLYTWAGRKWPAAPWSLLACAVLGLAVATGVGSGSPLFRLQYLITFALGVALAVRLADVRAWVQRRSETAGGKALLALLLVLAACLISLRGMMLGAGVDILVAERFDFLDILGCALLLVVTTMSPLGQRILETRLAQWLGLISFSLYLIHEPIVISVHELTGRTNPWLTPLIAIPISVLVAMFFRRFVEAPSHTLARRVGHRFS